jgi:leader peptidase (prepilin peptidase)/N-methyltransferase
MSSPWWLVAAGVAGAAIGGAFALLLPRFLRDPPTDRHPTTPTLTTLTTAATAVLFAGLTWHIPTVGVLLAAWCLAAVAVPLAVIDVAVRRLPDLLVGPAYATVLLVLNGTAVHSGLWWPVGRAVICSAIVGAAMLILALALPGQLGLGDVKLGALTALVAGAYSVSAAALATVGAFAGAGIVAAALLATGRTTARGTLPFGPYLLAAALATLLAAPL